jgi:UDP-glucose 4-epimerase
VREVVGLARRRPSWSLDKVTWQAGDVASTDLTTLLRGADAVVHTAWLIQPSHDPRELWRTNVIGSERVIAAVEAAKVPVLVHMSSVGAYSPAPRGQQVDETWPTAGIPELGYSWQKAYVERSLEALEERCAWLRVARLRPALIFKRASARHVRRLFLGKAFPRRLVSPELVRRALERSPVPLQVVHADDVAAAVHAVLRRDVVGPFNLATEPILGRAAPSGTAVLAAARALAAVTWRARLQPAEPGWIELAGSVPLMASDRARAELAWTPKHDARSTLRELLAGLRDDATGPTPPLSQGS